MNPTEPNELSPAGAQANAFPAPRVLPNEWHAFGGVWRLSVRRFFNPTRWLVFAGLLALLVLFSYAGARRPAQDFLPWVARFYVCFLVPVFAFLAAAGIIRDDLQAGSVDYLFTRPVRRPVFVFLRYLAHTGCAQLDFLLALAGLVIVGMLRDVPGVGAALPWLLLTQVLMVAAFSAFGFLCAMLTSRYVVIGLVYGAVIEVGLGNVPTQLNRLSMIREALGILAPVLDLNRVTTVGPLTIEAVSSPMATLALIGASVLMLGIAAVIFTWREPAGAAGREP
jgi:ABC-2 type transport system permease protein